MRPSLILLITTVLLSACAQQNRLDAFGQGPKAPRGTAEIEDTVDGLIVGHRLMSSGQYELAIRAYLRAANEQGFNVDVLSALGSANLKLGRLNQAEKLLRNAIEKDERFVPAWNNLGVVLMELDRAGEARQVFKTAFALDSGQSADIRENLRVAIARTEDSATNDQNNYNFSLVRRGSSTYELLSTP
ncbi:tetratricopeptide repeat protein [Actibacterium sp. 188UL27-1]|uniref:tetratricopeptide repeat protein n=1 Tax=Actibacterium sp. 188UL27-1 TaxID=2786961 RepID=UPI001959328E|nr:tetratricopeptide repeat protein [Actibacterium sp. 188UL27-1]MBM7068205.1 tetratricopeptide repeat protein [Actibacterium sp. 188UL27-1]